MRCTHFKTILQAVAMTILLFGFLGGHSVFAADCKGLSKSRCDSAASCSWVSGYVSKSGKKVSSYCRSKPKSGAAVTKSSGKAARSGSSAKGAEPTTEKAQKDEKKASKAKGKNGKKLTKKTEDKKTEKKKSVKKEEKDSKKKNSKKKKKKSDSVASPKKN